MELMFFYLIVNEEKSQKRKWVLLLTLFLTVVFFSFIILEDRLINIPPVNLIKYKTTVDVYSNDVVLITNTQTNSTLNAVSWYVFYKVEYIDFSSRVIDTRTTTLEEYLKSLP